MALFYVYLIVSNVKNRTISYVGYTNNINKRLKLHNTSKGAKFTRGRKWKIIYKKTYNTKSEAMKYEYKLKKDRNKREKIKKAFKLKQKKNSWNMKSNFHLI